ncbi:PH domain-containing protein [Clostridium tarantellae]|uniref:PH domain-containing protein n=1 Tax=Clostridium tarantellae TaxID=39493 RepID=A0A6I1MQJ6_9CLOT|nr:PH domain-containing protein [Clostridium tarantellae]MPQ45073.1 PH domain-containing protein [Clostridium tarantellae]
MLNLKISKKFIIDIFIMRNLIFLIFLFSIVYSFIKFNFTINLYKYTILLWILLYIIFVIITPVLEFIFWRYSITKKFIEVKYGIIFKKSKCIPIDRIKYIDIVQNPISKILRINKIKIYTAAGKIIIPGLNNDICKKICNIIKEKS